MYANDQERARDIWSDPQQQFGIYKYGYRWSEFSVISGNAMSVFADVARFTFAEYHEKIRKD